jgi:tyrosyl-tRNA synthetase
MKATETLEHEHRVIEQVACASGACAEVLRGGTKVRIVSGIQPTGDLHIGNYFGALRHWVALQSEAECFFMLADLHAITTPQNPRSCANGSLTQPHFSWRSESILRDLCSFSNPGSHNTRNSPGS